MVKEIGGFGADAIRGFGHGGERGFTALFDDLLGDALSAPFE